MKNNQKTANELLTFEEIFYEYYHQLVNYAYKYTLKRSVAEDILQDIFMQMWINKENIDFETKSIKPYLYKAVRNRCINHLQSIKEMMPLQTENIDLLIQKEVFEMPDELLSIEDLERELRQSIMSLPPKCRQIFIYSRYHNLKNKEISLMLGITEKAVEKHITKALFLIRKHLIDLNLLSALLLLA